MEKLSHIRASYSGPTWVVIFTNDRRTTSSYGTEDKDEAFSFAQKVAKKRRTEVSVYGYGRLHSKVKPSGKVDSSWQYRRPR